MNARTNVTSRVTHSRPVVVLEGDSANDGDLTEADLAEIDAQFASAAGAKTSLEPQVPYDAWTLR